MYEEARASHRETGNRRSEGFTLNNLALLEEVAGDWRAGWRLAEEALAITRQVGDRRFEGIVLGNLADCLVEGGLLEEARAAAETALEIHKEVGNVRYQGGVLISLAALERRTGQYRKAREALGVAIDRLRKVNDQFYVIMALVERAMVALAEREDPLPFVEQARGLAAAIGVPADSPAMLLLRRLDAALQDRDQGKALVHGESSAHVPEWLRLRHAEEDAGERMD
jgi:tetratricopeptide (TPR) repeat protein